MSFNVLKQTKRNATMNEKPVSQMEKLLLPLMEKERPLTDEEREQFKEWAITPIKPKEYCDKCCCSIERERLHPLIALQIKESEIVDLKYPRTKYHEWLRMLLKYSEYTSRKWMPMEHAPKDGTRILLWDSKRNKPFVGHWFQKEHGGEDYIWITDAVWHLEPTGWMPLPNAPDSNSQSDT